LRLEIRHTTRYAYDAPVFLNPHTLRLTPRTDASQRVESFDMTIDPLPVGRSTVIEPDAPDVVSTWFDSPTDHLHIATSSIVTTYRANPFDYLWQGERSLPVRYRADLAGALAPYLGGPIDFEGDLVRRARADAGGDAQQFPAVFALLVSKSFRYLTRVEGEARPPAETLSAGEGSCRDLTVLFLACARGEGYAGRFVSGYLAEGGEEHELHAWAELYLPGGGWRGFDPTTGLVVADRHVALAAAASPGLAAPVNGSFAGRARARLETDVQIVDLGG